ncbi:unnamed protein product [Trifolium pratense]|uniref:Uncharacterized protein n=1 Tax=Trifolium pratense TaxID=57577 RepID=A0ACB0K3U9_TRIPR|nr:unnamed protein product [Trifolium pratense]
MNFYEDEDEDCASADDSESCEKDESDDVAILSTSTQDLEFSTSQDSILFGSFASPIIPVSIPSITPDSDGFSFKIGEIPCFLGDSCCSNVSFMITASKEDKHSKDFETEFVLSAVSQKSQNQSIVQVFSSPIKFKRQHGGNVRFSQDRDQTSKKGELLSDLPLRLSKIITFFSYHRDLCIIVFDPGGTNLFRSSLFTSTVFATTFYLLFLALIFSLHHHSLNSSHFVFDPGGNQLISVLLNY